MLTLKGTYYNGIVKLEDKIKTDKPVKIIVTFVEEIKKPQKKKTRKRLKLSDFHFYEARELSKDFKGSLADAVIEERRNS